MEHICNGILLSHWKEWNKAIWRNMDGPRDCHTEWAQSDREGEISYDLPCVWNLKRNDTNKLTHQTERESQTLKTNLWLQGWGGEGIVRDFGKVMYTLLSLKWITNKDLLHSTWNSAQYYVAAWMGVGFGGEWIHVYVWLSPFAVHLKLSQHC